MTAPGISLEFIARLCDKKPLSQEEIKLAIQYVGTPDLYRFEEVLLSDIVLREEFKSSDHIKLLHGYLSQSEGPRIVVDALWILPFQRWTKEIREIGIDAVEGFIRSADENCRPRRDTLDFKMAHIIPHCLEEDDDSGIKRILSSFADYAAKPKNSMNSLKNTTTVIAQINPIAYLNAADPGPDGSTGFGFGNDLLKNSPLLEIPSEILKEWCSKDETRQERVMPYMDPENNPFK